MPTDHARLSPSAAHRWMHCPGSVRLCEPLPPETSPYAEEGTLAHAIAAEWLQARLFGDGTFDLRGRDVPQEMLEAVQVYVDFVCGLGLAGVQIEQRVGVTEDLWGTADCIGQLPEPPQTLYVVDLKYGMGVVVEADSPQLSVYAYLAMTERAESDVVQVIVQPRLRDEDGNPRIVSHHWQAKELNTWARDSLLPAVWLTRSPNAPLVAGDWCRFCPARRFCPELRQASLAVAQTEFADVVEDRVVLPRPQELSAPEIAKVLDAAPMLRGWLETIEEFARHELEAGREVPGYALTPKRGTRQWVDEGAAIAWAEETHHVMPAALFESKFKSPAQVEKTLHTKLPPHLTTMVSSGLKVVKADHPKALPAAVLEFTEAPDIQEA